MTDHVALLRLAWPTKPLWANSRVHWAKRSKAVAAYRREAYCLALEQPAVKLKLSRPLLTFTFHPPDNRRRDIHNMPHTMKATIDGIADAMGVDDQHFLCRWPGVFAKPVTDGCVLIEVKATPREIDTENGELLEW